MDAGIVIMFAMAMTTKVDACGLAQRVGDILQNGGVDSDIPTVNGNGMVLSASSPNANTSRALKQGPALKGTGRHLLMDPESSSEPGGTNGSRPFTPSFSR